MTEIKLKEENEEYVPTTEQAYKRAKAEGKEVRIPNNQELYIDIDSSNDECMCNFRVQSDSS